MENDPAQPLLFEPIFQERVWGGRSLERTFGKALPLGKNIGESWEIVDRAEAQSIVRQGPWRGRSLHEIWCAQHDEVFGREVVHTPRFPILAKLLDARAKLSVQVHPPARVAAALGGEPKTEMWFVADAEPGAEVFAGLRAGATKEKFVRALEENGISDLLHRLEVKREDAILIPSGRLHAIGAGNLIVEIQENSDTTYRVFDWNRPGDDGQPRKLHLEEAMQSIDFADFEPELVRPEGETLLQTHEFSVERWELDAPRPALTQAAAAIFCCLEGALEMSGVALRAGDFFLVPASAGAGALRPGRSGAKVLRVALPTR